MVHEISNIADNFVNNTLGVMVIEKIGTPTVVIAVCCFSHWLPTRKNYFYMVAHPAPTPTPTHAACTEEVKHEYRRDGTMILIVYSVYTHRRICKPLQ